MQPDLYEITASEGDRLLLCSDGLTGMVDDGSIQAMLARIRDPQRCAAALVKEAIANGGSDNITVIVVDITGTNAKAERRERRRSRAWIILMLVALVGIIGGSIFAAYNWMQNSAYLAEKDGNVVIYRGIPDSFPGIETHWLVEETDLKVKDLQPGMQTRISENYPVENVDEAERLVEKYKLQAKEDAAAEEARTGTSSSSSSAKPSSKGSSSSSAAKR